jgi:hypothetical protein
MKKKVFLIVSTMAILFSGCTGSSDHLHRAFGEGHHPISATILIPLNERTDRGICLPISTRSSLNIDVECILTHVRNEPASDQEARQDDWSHPWVRLNFSF